MTPPTNANANRHGSVIMSLEDMIRDTISNAMKDALTKTIAPNLLQHTQRLLSTKQSAEYLSCSVEEIRHLVAAGKLKVIRLSEDSNKWRFDRRDLDILIDANKENASAT